MPDQTPDLMAVTKTLTTVPEWKEHGDQFRFVSTLDVDGVTQEGLWLLGRCLREHPDCDVTFQIDRMYAGFRRGPAMRLDWRPKNSHTNKNLGPSELRLRIIEGSHVHPFDENWTLGFQRMVSENLPIAIPLDEDPKDFAALTQLAGELFRIDGLESLPVPSWEPRML